MNDCSKCGGMTDYRNGVAKATGKPWEGYKCKECGNMDFVRNAQPKPVAQKPASNGKTSENTMLFAYAKDIVVAEINSTKSPDDVIDEPFKRVCDGYKLFLKAYNNPYGE